MCRHLQGNISEQRKTNIQYEMTELSLSDSAHLISSLGQFQVHFKIDSIGMDNKTALNTLFNGDEPHMVAVCHAVEGLYPGNIVFMMEEQQSCDFTKTVLSDGHHLKDMSEMEEEALTELGNIIVNDLLRHYVDLLDNSLSTHIPTLKRGHYDQLIDELSSDAAENDVYRVKFSIEISTIRITAFILWFGRLSLLLTNPIETQKIED